MIRMSKRGQRSRTLEFVEDPETGRIYPIPAGGAGDEDDGGADEDEDGDEDGDDDDLDDEDDDDTDDDREPSKGAVSRKEYERLMKRMKAADRRADAAERKVKEREDEEKSELQKAQDDLEELSTERDRLVNENKGLTLRLAVLTAKESSKFHDPEDLLLRLSLDDLTDEDGDLDQDLLKKELKRLAKEKPHLVRASDGKDDDDDDEEDSGPPKSGRQTNKKKKKEQGLDRARLEKKYSALRR